MSSGPLEAIAEGRYKAVNMVGAGVIAAVANALERRPFPFVFGGDGASFAVAPSEAPAAARALAAMAAFAHAEFELDLRIATIPVREEHPRRRSRRPGRALRRVGALQLRDVRRRRLELVRGAGEAPPQFTLPSSGTAPRPTFPASPAAGGDAPAKYGVVLSVIVSPRGDDPRYPALVDDVVQMALGAAQSGRPITVESLGVGAAGQAIALEACAVKASGVSRLRAQLTAATNYLMGLTFHKLKLKAGSFDAALYAAEVADNADFRKFDTGCAWPSTRAAFADALEARLAAASDFADWASSGRGPADHLFVPSISQHDHVHFVDSRQGRLHHGRDGDEGAPAAQGPGRLTAGPERCRFEKRSSQPLEGEARKPGEMRGCWSRARRHAPSRALRS